MTLGEMVDDILSSLDSDPVTTYNDTVEGEQVALILRTTYYNLIDGKDWPQLYTMFQLTQSSSSTPTHMTLGTTITDVKYIKYNVKSSTDTVDKFIEIEYKTPQEFMAILDARPSDNTSVTQITDASGIYLNIVNDQPPMYYTSFDESTIIFDAFDNTVETFLKTIKTQCYGRQEPTVTLSDGMYFNLPTDAFSLLLNEAKAVAWAELKQVQNPKAEQHANSQRRRMSQEAWKLKNGIKYPNLGRKGKK